ncbi:MAG: hypothetical protein LBR06_04275 [Bacteroidales bacterium]|jgi:hypothetical protein|nr:hypothetical protein [Bacteroidales bacterium]
MVTFVGNFKGESCPASTHDGFSVTFRCVVDDEVWSLEYDNLPVGYCRLLAEMCCKILEELKKGNFKESMYLPLL